MKKKCFLALVIISASIYSTALAQDALKKGVYSLSGSVTLSTSTNESKYDETKSLDLSLTPALTYFFIDNFSAGINISFGYSETTFKDKLYEATYIYRPYSIGATARYYFSSDKLIPFIEAGYNYNNFVGEHDDMNTAKVAAGINYFLSRSVALEPYIEYRRITSTSSDQKINGFSTGLRVAYFIVD